MVSMNRRDLLKSIGGACGTLSLGGGVPGTAAAERRGGADRSSRGRPPRVGDPGAGAAESAGPEGVLTDDGAVSLRRIGEKMDPVRPATRVRGHGTPHDRPGPDEHDDGDLPPADTYSYDASHLPDAVDEDAAVGNAYDFGMAHRTDKGVVEQHRFTADRGTRSSVRDVVDRHAGGDSREFKWLFLNVYLPYMDGFDGGNYYNAGDYWDRRPEIGWTVRDEGYDVACLCEAFEVIEAVGQCANPFRGDGAYLDPTEEIVEAAGNVVDHARGPDRYNDKLTCNATDGGLLAMLMDVGDDQPPNLVRHRRGAFSPEHRKPPGHRGNKGWSYLEVDLGVGTGNVDLFHTHMQAGAEPGARNGQLSELLSAVERHSRPENVTVVGGDMNYDHRDWKLKGQPNYERLLSAMGEADLQEVWLTHGGIESTTGNIDVTADPAALPFCEGAGGPDCGCRDYLVDDPSGATRGEKYRNCTGGDCDTNNTKLDYVFVERPKPAHRIDLDLRRVRRRVFPRTGDCSIPTGGHDSSWSGEEVGPGWDTHHGEHNYLGDHLGIELRTVVSPR